VPPLRERREEIPALAERTLAERAVVSTSPRAISCPATTLRNLMR